MSQAKLLFSEAKVDAHTGQVTLRGEFPNPKRDLLPGMYVRVQIEQGIDSDAIAVPQQAIQRNSGGGSEAVRSPDAGSAAGASAVGSAVGASDGAGASSASARAAASSFSRSSIARWTIRASFFARYSSDGR